MRGPQGAADTIHSLSCAPLLRAEPASSITITEIERQVEALRARWPEGAQLRELAMLFAILKEGSSTIKLKWFTKYDDHFIRFFVEELRQHGKLFTGTLTAQFILSQLPGSEHLIEAITGVRPAKPSIAIAPAVAPPIHQEPTQKENNAMSTKPTDDGPVQPVKPEAASAQCPRDSRCTKPENHLGRCATGKAAKTKRRAGLPARTASAAPKTASMPAVKATAAMPASTFHFTVFCKVDGEEYKAEGASHGKLQSALATIDRMLGGVN
jgi:hypothetical protein